MGWRAGDSEMAVLRGVRGRRYGGVVAGFRPPAAAIQPAMRPSRAVGSYAPNFAMPVAPAAPKKINIPVNIPKIFIA